MYRFERYAMLIGALFACSGFVAKERLLVAYVTKRKGTSLRSINSHLKICAVHAMEVVLLMSAPKALAIFIAVMPVTIGVEVRITDAKLK